MSAPFCDTIQAADRHFGRTPLVPSVVRGRSPRTTARVGDRRLYTLICADIDLNSSSNQRFSCVESAADESINASMRSRTRFFFCPVQIFGAIVSKASAQIASARVAELNVLGSNARSLIGTSISRNSCSFSLGMMFCRCSAIARNARPSSPLSLRRRYNSCATIEIVVALIA